MIITLTPDQYVQDDLDAAREIARAITKRWQKVGHDPGDAKRLYFKIGALRSERAMAIYGGDPLWERDRNGFRKPDQHGFSVRMASEPGYGLVIHLSRDGDYPYILVEMQDGDLARLIPGVQFRVIGRMEARRARELARDGVGHPLPGTTNPWKIPVSHRGVSLFEPIPVNYYVGLP